MQLWHCGRASHPGELTPKLCPPAGHSIHCTAPNCHATRCIASKCQSTRRTAPTASWITTCSPQPYTVAPNLWLVTQTPPSNCQPRNSAPLNAQTCGFSWLVTSDSSQFQPRGTRVACYQTTSQEEQTPLPPQPSTSLDPSRWVGEQGVVCQGVFRLASLALSNATLIPQGRPRSSFVPHPTSAAVPAAGLQPQDISDVRLPHAPCHDPR